MKMRKLLPIFLAILLMAGNVYAATPGYRSDPGIGDILGQGKQPSDPHRIFRLVRYHAATLGASALAANSIVIWNLTDDDGVTVTTSTTSADSAVAGIIVQQALTSDAGNTAAQDVGNVNWTWLQTYGLTTVNLATTTAAVVAGDALGTSTVAGESAPFLPSTTNEGANGNCGFYYDAAVTGDDGVQVFLRCN
jgi:hypothetical protein